MVLSPHPSQTIRRAGPGELRGVVVALARAFYDDPCLSWFFPDEGRRLRQLEALWSLMLRKVYLRYEETYTTAEAVGAAVWAPPGRSPLGLADSLRLAPGWMRIEPRRVVPNMRAVQLVESRHPRERHYYLWAIGVVPERQGRGLGTALMGPVLERCDRERVPAYLEASTARSRACYERVGFEAVEEVSLPRGGPPFWPMWRAPRG